MPKREATLPQYMCGWKEIAQYLNRGVRTIQRYERMYGLPIHRPSGSARGAVLATKIELDAWVVASPLRRTLQLQAPKFSGVTALREGIAETHRLRQVLHQLREETHKLHSDLHKSIQTLQKTIDEVYTDGPHVRAKDKDWIV